MEPNWQAALNPTPTQVYFPQQGIFKAVGDYGSTIYIRKPGPNGKDQIYSFDLTTLLTPEEKKNRNAGEQASMVREKLQKQYGFNLNNLPEYNLADAINDKSLDIQGYADQGVWRRKIVHGTGPLDMFIGSKPAGSTSGVINPPGTVTDQMRADIAASNAAKTAPTVNSPQGNTAASTAQPPNVALQPGSTGADVEALQKYLVAQGYMTQAEMDTGPGTYGPRTTAAVKKMQEALGVDNSTGPGYFGPRTMAALASAAPASTPSMGTSTGGTTTPGGSIGSTGSTTTGSPGGTTGPLPNQSTIQDNELETILQGLPPDQQEVLRTLFQTVSLQDTQSAEQLQAAFAAAEKIADPIFKAQVRMVEDALTRGINRLENDKQYQEGQLNQRLGQLREDIAASKDVLSFEQQNELTNLERQYTTQLEDTRQGLAASGFTSSSRRARAEKDLSDINAGLIESNTRRFGEQNRQLNTQLSRSEQATQQEIARLGELAGRSKEDLARGAEADLGSAAFGKSFGNLPQLGGVPGSIPTNRMNDILSGTMKLSQFTDNKFVF